MEVHRLTNQETGGVLHTVPQEVNQRGEKLTKLTWLKLKLAK